MKLCSAPLLLFALTGTGIAEISLPRTEAALKVDATDTVVRRQWAMAELERVLGPREWKALSNGPRSTFFREMQGTLLDELMFSGPLPEDPAKMMRIAEALWKQDRSGMADRHELTTAAAVALMYAAKDWPEDQADERYRYFRDSRKAGKLHPVFDTLATWEKRFVVSAGGNGGWAGDGGWGEESMLWLRDHVKLPVKDYTDACWQAPYRLENVFGDSIHGSRYYAPFEKMIHAERVREVGGVCGSLSHYGATAARANGIPAITMGEPGHCAYAVRTAPGEWTPAYSLSWERGLHTSLWGRTWTQLVLQEKVLGEKYATDRSSLHLWQARALRGGNPDLAEKAYLLALKAQPLDRPLWSEYVAWLRDSRKPEPLAWKKVHDDALAALATYPEAAWDVVKDIEVAMIGVVPEDERIPFLLSFHNAIASHKGPVMWDLPKALGEQAKMLGKPAAELEFFEQVVSLQSKSDWLAPVVAWGSERFGKGGDTAWYEALGRGLSTGGSAGDSTRKALRPAILAAAATDNVEAFQALARAVATDDGPKLPPMEPFPGELLSAGGLIRLSTTSNWDAPESHAAVLEAKGGRLHTDSEVNPHVVVRFAKLGELSGIAFTDTSTGYNASRIVPLKVSVSEDGQGWQEVFRTEKPGGPWRIDLTGKAPRVGWVKIERDDDRKEVFHLSAIHVYGRRLQ
ncbi:hypothetical protein OKA04_00215 [Luteolibacter flavescens]|uniref:F5/8 type C domain-containing protein n=1 Tax=Luteolibacter flavescens TaxID=1859460 RepID=A0ABT3FHY1_9BACT|nr:hypothetical protein [Luteolibacter flavescens]MCW1883130.1 hypothetical protein [Luteolibacter flavescens]